MAAIDFILYIGYAIVLFFIGKIILEWISDSKTKHTSSSEGEKTGINVNTSEEKKTEERLEATEARAETREEISYVDEIQMNSLLKQVINKVKEIREFTELIIKRPGFLSRGKPNQFKDNEEKAFYQVELKNLKNILQKSVNQYNTTKKAAYKQKTKLNAIRNLLQKLATDRTANASDLTKLNKQLNVLENRLDLLHSQLSEELQKALDEFKKLENSNEYQIIMKAILKEDYTEEFKFINNSIVHEIFDLEQAKNLEEQIIDDLRGIVEEVNEIEKMYS